MTSTLEKELTAAGYTPEPVPIDGDVAWTGWHAPVQKDTYEVYYDFCTGAMYAQAELPPWGSPPRATVLADLPSPDGGVHRRRRLLAQRVPGAARSGGPLMALPQDGDFLPPAPIAMDGVRSRHQDGHRRQ